ncbi:hypothetical protein F5884DRAFT_855550 [Xylogone sp. PMI_703]|nr:hypothetical protein F5884DRAFT_855550 [Xylogone sp. PMI_703]
MAKIDSFQAAYASIVFFEDPTPYEPLMAYKSYVDKFESWLGAHLQHYNPLIDEEVKKTWSVSAEWKLTGQMVVGKLSGDQPPAKDKKAVSGRVRVIS